MYILGIDSSAGRVSIAVNSEQQLLSKVEYGKNQRYMVSIISLIDKALKKASISLDLVDLFAVNIGPGDFTGTRIGMSVAKTLAWVGSKPIFGIGSLNITALGIFFKNLKKIQKLLGEGKQIIIAPVLDVKRNEVYFSFLKVEESSLGNSKDENSEFRVHAISNISIQNKNYFINKVSGGYLAESKDFTKKFSALFVPDNGFSFYILLGGSGFSSYKHLESEVKELGGSRSDSHLSSLTGVDKRVFPPDAFHLNLCAYYSYLKNRQTNYNLDDYGLAPLYVREFAPFKT
ncbi:MAG: tRNA (adenosine(37)-N6)-threonylcarbamoyltransferase complex dimerization subunit type 1 TsaB [Actinobacteria bacterium]|nr:tRNA (adenosine(37)-N6)-threonylcarbamoyltransferase complex dimerization subunit type 1 TsaB [Actinomycetota bacterium]